MIGTITEKILGCNTTGMIVERNIDLLMGHDGTAVLAVDEFRRSGLKIWNKDQVRIIFDHFAPPASIERANIQNKLISFVKEYDLPFSLYEGICHQLLIEDPQVVPGKVIAGADSHTVSSGALGCFATGIGATDFLQVLQTGRLWFRIPECNKIVFRGRIPSYIEGKDLVLEVIRQIGQDGAIYKALEFFDETDNGISIDNRITISNMSVEMGAKAGIFCPDNITEDYVKQKGGVYLPILPSEHANYASELIIQVDCLKPLVSIPHSLEVKEIRELAGQEISQAFIGSCTAGRLEDLKVSSEVWKMHPIDLYTKTIVIPSSKKVYLEALKLGYISDLLTAGAVVSNSSCGPCCNIDKGLIGDNETAISTSNRNFQGRMGSINSRVYLASTLSTSLAASFGHIVDPCDYF